MAVVPFLIKPKPESHFLFLWLYMLCGMPTIFISFLLCDDLFLDYSNY